MEGFFRTAAWMAACALAMNASVLSSFAGPREQALQLHQRLAGVDPSEAVLDQMEQLIASGDKKAAARIATGTDYFYNLSLVRFALPWSNVNETLRVSLNDLVATVVGMVRDNEPFNTAFTGDIVYTLANPTTDADANGIIDGTNPTIRVFARNNNNHYLDLESRRINLRTALTKQSQTTLTGLQDTAGIMTTRAWAEAYMSAGTNRRPTRFAFKVALCRDMEEVSDSNVSDFRIRRDVDRAPGGDRRTFLTTCKGCHGGMDALSGAWAYFNFNNNQLEHTPGTVVAKMNQNNTVFPNGYVTRDDSWINLWNEGVNATQLEWRSTVFSGNGAKAFGQMITRTGAFGKCMAKKVFEFVCVRPPAASEASVIAALASKFEQSNFNMRDLFEEAAILPQCIGR